MIKDATLGSNSNVKNNITYRPLSEVTKTLRVKWFRSPIPYERLRELSIRTDKQGWQQAGGHILLYLALSGATIFFWYHELWLLFWLSLWCVGFVATFYKGTGAHELGHGTVFKSRSLNSIFLYAVCLISWWDPHNYAASHTYHHRFTTHKEADRENVLPLTPSLHPWLLFQLFTFSVFLKPARNFSKGGFLWTVYITGRTALGKPVNHIGIPSQEWLKSLHEDQPDTFRQSVRWSRMLLIFHGCVLLLAWISGWWVLPLVLTLPSYIANIGSYLLGTTQHCGLVESSDDFRKNTRSIRLPAFLEFLYWHMNWHTEHHMYAGVPCYNLKQLAKELEPDMPEPLSLSAAWMEMRAIWRQQRVNPDYVFDRPVPAMELTTSPRTEDDLVQSIGDLAPDASPLK